ncbi:hypothetical protein Tco_0818570 [Tanacetum coccineum]
MKTFYEAWDRFKDLLQACPHHGFSELHQLDTFYNALNSNDQDSLNSAAGGNFLDKMPRDCLRIIESKSKVHNSRNKPVVAKVSSSTSTPGISPDVAELKDMVKALLLDKKNQNQAPTPVKAVEERTLPSNTITNPKVDLKGITTQSGVAYQGPMIPTTSSPPKVVERETEVTKDTVLPTNNGIPNSEPVVIPVSGPIPNLKSSIPYPLRRNDEKRHEKSNDQVEKFYKIFQDMSFEISLADTLILMPKFASTLKALIGNKEKLSEMAKTPLNEHCSAVILNKLPEKLGDPGKFLIPLIFLLEESMIFSALEDDPNFTTGKLMILTMTQKGIFFFLNHFSIDEPLEVKLKDLPPHLEYSFLEGNNKLPVIIAKDLSVKEKAALIKVLKSHKRSIAWKLSDIKGINPEFCTHKILMEEDYKPTVQHQRLVNLKIYDVIKKEVEKLLNAGLIYPISDSP